MNIVFKMFAQNIPGRVINAPNQGGPAGMSNRL